MKFFYNKSIININENCKNEMNNYNQNRIIFNIKLHKIFLIVVILINIFLLFFIHLFKLKIERVKKNLKFHSTNVNDIQKNDIYYKIMNMIAQYSFPKFRFSFIFESREEFKKLKNLILNFRYELGDKINPDEFYPNFVYQSNYDFDDYYYFIHTISYYISLTILIKTEKGDKFGIYHKHRINPNKKNEFISDSKDVFIFNFDGNIKCKFIGEEYSLRINENQFINLGDNELVIYKKFLTNGGRIKFPMNSFDCSKVNTNILNKKNEKFKISHLEIFSFNI